MSPLRNHQSSNVQSKKEVCTDRQVETTKVTRIYQILNEMIIVDLNIALFRLLIMCKVLVE